MLFPASVFNLYAWRAPPRINQAPPPFTSRFWVRYQIATMLHTLVLPIWLCRKICNGNLRRTVSQYILNAMGGELFTYSWEPRSSRKNSGSHIDASLSRQPLVKGERLVRYEVNAVIIKFAQPCTTNSGYLCKLIVQLAFTTSDRIDPQRHWHVGTVGKA